MANVDIIIRTISDDKGTQKQLKQSFTEINQAVELLRKGLEAAKKAYDFSKEGAQIEFTATRFDRLASSIGTTSDALLNELQKATKGTLSDMELMASATDLVGLGLAKTQDEAVRLATVSAGLGMNMNQLVLTLTNQTTMRFDALGVSVDGFKEKVNALKESGMDANEAFKEAFLQQAEEQLNRVGNAADSTLGTFQRFEAIIKNNTDALKKFAADGLEPVIKNFVELHDIQERYNEVVDATGEKNNLHSRSQANHNTVMQQTIKHYEELWKEIDNANGSFDRFTTKTEDVTAITEEMSKTNQRWLDSITAVSDEYKNQTEKMNSLSQERADTEAEMQTALAQGWWEGSDKIQGYKNKLQELQDKENEYTANFEENKNKRIFGMIEEQLASDGLTLAETTYLQELGLQWGIYTESAVTAMQEAQAQAQLFAEYFNNLPDEKIVTLRLETRGFDQGLAGLAAENTVRKRSGRGYASGTGGWATVPPGYPNDSYPMMVSSGEKVNVVPKGQNSGMGLSQSDIEALTTAFTTALMRAGA